MKALKLNRVFFLQLEERFDSWEARRWRCWDLIVSFFCLIILTITVPNVWPSCSTIAPVLGLVSVGVTFRYALRSDGKYIKYRTGFFALKYETHKVMKVKLVMWGFDSVGTQLITPPTLGMARWHSKWWPANCTQGFVLASRIETRWASHNHADELLEPTGHGRFWGNSVVFCFVHDLTYLDLMKLLDCTCQLPYSLFFLFPTQMFQCPWCNV